MQPAEACLLLQTYSSAHSVKLEGDYLQLFPNLSESDCSYPESDYDCLETGCFPSGEKGHPEVVKGAAPRFTSGRPVNFCNYVQSATDCGKISCNHQEATNYSNFNLSETEPVTTDVSVHLELES